MTLTCHDDLILSIYVLVLQRVMNCTENKVLYSMCCILTSIAILLKTDLNDNDLKREGVNVIVQSVRPDLLWKGYIFLG